MAAIPQKPNPKLKPKKRLYEFKPRIFNVTLLTGNGEDIIVFDINSKTTHPEMKYQATGKIRVRKGYGEQWCNEVLGIKPKIIDIT